MSQSTIYICLCFIHSNNFVNILYHDQMYFSMDVFNVLIKLWQFRTDGSGSSSLPNSTGSMLNSYCLVFILQFNFLELNIHTRGQYEDWRKWQDSGNPCQCCYLLAGFLHTCSSKFKFLSIKTPKSFSLLLSQIISLPTLTHKCSVVPEASRWHLLWFNCIKMFSYQRMADQQSSSNS